MIVYDLIARTENEMTVAAALAALEQSGPFYTADFIGRDGSMVIVFWILGGNDQVIHVWEHTMGTLPGLTSTGEVRYMDYAS